jgi:phosphogluconate dehydratase
MLRPVADAFQSTGGMKLLSGNLGRAIIKTSAVDPQHRVIEAPARVFDDQDKVLAAFKAGELDRDVVVIVRFQGPAANGMPELHKLTPALGVLQDRGYRVALVTDGRMSGASGKVPAAIHLYPEALHGGPIARVADGDRVRVDAAAGVIEVLDSAFLERLPAPAPAAASGLGRELFRLFQQAVDDAEQGASPLLAEMSRAAS